MESGSLQDYTGAFDPKISWEHFSREKLIEALNLYSNLHLAIDGFWYLMVKERYGDEVALDIDLKAWDKYLRYETKRVAQLMSITGRDVDAFLKLLQFTPWSGNIKFTFDRIDSNHSLIRVNHCPTLQSLIKEGQGREQYFCRRVEVPMFEMEAHALNPELQVNALHLPPETIGSDLCCEWEIKLPR